MTAPTAQHTPGPWTVGLTIGSAHTSPEGPWGWYQTDIEAGPGEGCFLELRQYHGGEIGQANARLIAAAPDLLAALRQMWLAFTETSGRSAARSRVNSPECHAAIEAAYIAVSKAEGRS